MVNLAGRKTLVIVMSNSCEETYPKCTSKDLVLFLLSHAWEGDYSAQRRFGAETIQRWPIRRGDFLAQFHFFTKINAWVEYEAGAHWVRCPERHTGIFFS